MSAKLDVLEVANSEVDIDRLQPLPFSELWATSEASSNSVVHGRGMVMVGSQRLFEHGRHTILDSKDNSLSDEEKSIITGRLLLSQAITTSMKHLGGYFDATKHRSDLTGLAEIFSHNQDDQEITNKVSSLKKTIEARYLVRSKEQIAELNQTLKLDPVQAWARIGLRGVTRMAKLRGIFLDSVDDGTFQPGLLLQSKRQTVGLPPESSRIWGLYYKK